MTKKVLIIVLALAVAGGGIWFWQKGENDTPSQNTNTQTNNQTQQPEIEIPSDWKKYSNTDLGISFRYPSEWGEVSIGNQSQLVFSQGLYFSENEEISLRMHKKELIPESREGDGWNVTLTNLSESGSKLIYWYGEDKKEEVNDEKSRNNNDLICKVRTVYINEFQGIAESDEVMATGICGLTKGRYGAILISGRSVKINDEKLSSLSKEIELLIASVSEI